MIDTSRVSGGRQVFAATATAGMLGLVTVLEVVRYYTHVLVFLNIDLLIDGTLINDRF